MKKNNNCSSNLMSSSISSSSDTTHHRLDKKNKKNNVKYYKIMSILLLLVCFLGRILFIFRTSKIETMITKSIMQNNNNSGEGKNYYNKSKKNENYKDGNVAIKEEFLYPQQSTLTHDVDDIFDEEKNQATRSNRDKLTALTPDEYDKNIAMENDDDYYNDTEEEESRRNSKLIQEHRALYENQCLNEASSDEEVLNTLQTIFVSQKHVTTTTETTTYEIENHDDNNSNNINNNYSSNKIQKTTIRPCKYLFLDLGSNNGDSLFKFIDSGYGPCPKKGIDKPPKIDFNTTLVGKEYYSRRGNTLRNRLKTMLKKLREAQEEQQQVNRYDVAHRHHHYYPEEYCFYGIEGNPIFTKQLKTIEEKIMMKQSTNENNSSYNSRKTIYNLRPIKRLHFFTESVVTNLDGPTILYLDTINEKGNFWGSSIISSHKDVAESLLKLQDNSKNNNTIVSNKAHVQGYKLTTLLKETAFVPKHDGQNKQKHSHRSSNKNNNGNGGHIIIKMDIEGAEYAVFNELNQSGILCNYIQNYNYIIHMIIEKHPMDFFGDKPNNTSNIVSDYEKFDSIKDFLMSGECGVIFKFGEYV